MTVEPYRVWTGLHPAPDGKDAARLGSPSARALFTVAACGVVGSAVALGIVPGIAALVAVVLAFVVLRRPVVGALILVAVVPVASGLRRGFPIPQLRLSEAMIASIAALILLAAKPGQTAPWRPFDWVALAYAVATAGLGAFDLAHRGESIGLDQAFKLLGPLQFFLLYRAALTTLTTADRRRTALRLILFASVPVSFLALLQQLHVAGIPHILANLTDSQIYLETTEIPRATGPFAHWHDLGSYLFVVVLLGFALIVSDSRHVMNRRLLVGIVALAVIALVNTVSFTPLAGAVAGCALLMPLSRHRRQWVVGLAVCAVVIGVVFGPLLKGRYEQQFGAHAPVKQYAFLPQNFNFRIYVWKTEFVPLVKENLLSGYGPDLPSNIPFAYTESIYMTLLLRGGLPLLIIYAGLMLTLALRARDLRMDPDPERQAVARVVYAVVLTLVFMQIVTNYFVNAGLPHLLWILAAFLFAKSASERRHPVPWSGAA